MIITLNEGTLRKIIREAIKEKLTMYKYPNMEVSYPSKGRTAKKITKEEFEKHLTDFFVKYSWKEDMKDDIKNGKRLKPRAFFNYALQHNKSIPKRLRDDLNEIEHDEENMGPIGDIQIANGVPYIQGEMGGDWESPIFFVIYWDGKELRGYIPTKGNSFDRFRKIALGNDDEEDAKFLEKVRCKVRDGHSAYFNKEECIKDFKYRIGLLKK